MSAQPLKPIPAAAIRLLDLSTMLRKIAETDSEDYGFLLTVADYISTDASAILDADREQQNHEEGVDHD